MRKTKITLALLTLLVATTLAGCYTGPRYLSRTVDDWHNNLYTETPLLAGVLTIVPVIQVAELVANIGDALVINPVQFWIHDVWTGEGAGFQHENPKSDKAHWVADEKK